MGGLPDVERVMFIMCDTRNLTIYNHLDQEGHVCNQMPRRGSLLIAKGAVLREHIPR